MLFQDQVFCLNDAVHTNLFKLIVKGCDNFINMLPHKIICDKILSDVSLRNSVDSERHSVYLLIGTSYFSICFDY